ncbi:MAG: hypothetical protein LBK61_01545 [Spirochaetaceae bacterium]|jgi:hypothetical protein|nr:hypothetical protein [Spirochaetaceae bacterium]
MMKKSFIRTSVLWAVFLVVAVPSGFCNGDMDGVSGAPTEEVSLEAVFDSGHWVTRPSGSVITVFGVAGRRGNREEGVQAALLDAARKAALYHGVHAESASVLNQGSGALDYFSDFDSRLELRRNPEEFLDALVFDRERDVLEKNGVVFARVRYAGVSNVPPYASALADGVPDWTKNYVVTVPGYLAGIGSSKNKGSLQKTYEASYENAIASLLPQLSTRVASDAVDVDGGRVTRNATLSEGDLAEVMILETWFDRKTSAVWTLIAAKMMK